MTKMEKVKANFREFVQAKTTKASVAASVVLPVLVASVSALEGETASSGDMFDDYFGVYHWFPEHR